MAREAAEAQELGELLGRVAHVVLCTGLHESLEGVGVPVAAAAPAAAAAAGEAMEMER